MVALGICGSPRAGGNTAAAVADVLAGAAAVGHVTTSIQLEAGTIAPVADCSVCVARGACTQSDDFNAVIDQVTSCDLLVLGTPLYWYGPSAQFKAFLDRWSCRLDLDDEGFRAKMSGKRVVLVVAQGERGFYEAGPCLQMMDWTLRYLDMVQCARIVIVGHSRCDYLADQLQRDRVLAAGQSAASGMVVDVMPPWFHLRHRPGEPLGGTYVAG